MSESKLSHEFVELVLFFVDRIKSGDHSGSIEDVVRQWRDESESAATVRNIRQGSANYEAEKTVPADGSRVFRVAESA